MSESESRSAGWLASLRRIGVSLLSLIGDRFELFAIELQEEKLRLFDLMLWLGVALAVGAGGLLVAIAALALWLWGAWRYLGLVVLALAALSVAAAILAAIRRRIRTEPPPFADTLGEFRKDGKLLRKQ